MKILIIIAALILLYIVVFMIYTALMRRGVKKHEAQAVLVLGCKLHSDGSISHTLENRLKAALFVMDAAGIKKVIVSGGKTPWAPISEARAMEDFLVKNGVAKESILPEDRSMNTHANLKNVSALLERESIQKVILVTSDYHLFRALHIARVLGINARGYPAKGPKGVIKNTKRHLSEIKSWLLRLVHYLKYGN